MKKIGITGSLASGKTTASKILSSGNGPLFSADNEVKKLYKNKLFKKIITKKFKIKNNKNLKKILRTRILQKKSNIKKLENIIHPIVRREMNKFIKKNKTKKFVFMEIPLLIESKLYNKFDSIFFIKAKKSLRLKRFLLKGGERKLFAILNKKQLTDEKKIKFCDYVIVNDRNKKMLKKKLLYIFHNYE
tara:strand:+ start:875 stop:1441 length:567 start_codon:yes stop_codon:yes gene_type:complete